MRAAGSALIALALGLVQTACTHEVLLRTDYDLTHIEHVVASSSVIEPRHVPKRLAPGRVRIIYPLLIQNRSTDASGTSYTLALSQGSVDLGKSAEGTNIQIPAVCRPKDQEGTKDITLSPDQKIRIECSAEIVTDDRNRLNQRDTHAFFVVPVERPAGKRVGTFRFRYLLKIEDFE